MGAVELVLGAEEGMAGEDVGASRGGGVELVVEAGVLVGAGELAGGVGGGFQSAGAVVGVDEIGCCIRVVDTILAFCAVIARAPGQPGAAGPRRATPPGRRLVVRERSARTT